MPAGFGKRCWDCYWGERLQREVETNLHLFKSDNIKTAYQDFINWFVERSDNQNVVLEHLKFTTFFKTCDELWHKIPSYNSLVREFKPEGLRHYLTALRWLIETEQVVVDLKIKNEIAEKERIFNLFEKFEAVPESIGSYYEFLNEKLSRKKTSIKSIRLALQPAVGIYIELGINRLQQPSQEQLETYLRQKQGQLSAITGFISHLNRKYDTNIQCNKPDPEVIRRDRRKKLEKEIIAINLIPNPTSKDYEKWIAISLEYYHELKVSKKTIATLNPDQDKHKVTIKYDNQEYVIPSLENLNITLTAT